MKKKKILFLIESLNGGGAEKVLLDLVNNLNQQKYQITVQTIWNEGIYQDQFVNGVRIKTISHHRRKKSIYNSLIVRGYKYWFSTKWIYSHFIKDDYDVEIAFLEGLATKYIASSTNKEAKKIAWVHIDLDSFFYTKNYYRSMDQYVSDYRQFNHIVCVSQSVQKGFKKRFGIQDKVEVIHNIVNGDEILRQSKETMDEMVLISNKMILTTIGRLTYQKGYDRLLRIHKKLMEENYQYHLWIIGDGEERAKLQAFIDENRLNESVQLLGFQKNPYKYLAKSDLFVCSSYEEGFSTVVTEATLLGIPTVTTKCAGMDELFGDSEYGLIVDNNEDALYQGIKRMISEPKLLERYNKGVKEKRSQFDYKKNLAKIENLLDN